MSTRVGVLMGGPSAEHEVSLASGLEILKNLDRNAYRARAVVISREGRFFHCDADAELPSSGDLAAPGDARMFEGPLDAGMTGPLWEKLDVAVLGLHGSFGEDGRIQGFLDTVGIPYTGSGVSASAIGMDKIASQWIFQAAGMTTPPSSVYTCGHPEVDVDALAERHGFPCYAKCPQSGSSRLMGRAGSRAELERLLDDLSPHADQILVESSVDGDEYSCPVLEYPDGSLAALPPILIRPLSSSFFDYTAKYAAGACEEIVPAPCPPGLTRRIQECARKAHAVLGCRGLTRTDMIVKDGSLYILELNTLPGLTPASLAPKAFAAAGGTYSQLLDILVETALRVRRV
ncbi:MAG: D-alanine--D-alanine ligase [Chitinivibrionales bacterium]|nr:D-alanine--D-alanine ligase [Chitinivibrionales bacterium]MBD3396810.1 D-alanine--D-alanine ligase [Chitinivibrionales bacterium]